MTDSSVSPQTPDYSALSAEDRRHLADDILLYGNAIIKRNDDGSLSRVDPSKVKLVPHDDR